MPPLLVTLDNSWLPSTVQPAARESKPGLVTWLAPALERTSTSSTTHSPSPSKLISKPFNGELPSQNSCGPVYSIMVQGGSVGAALSAQLAASRLSLFGSVNSRLAPPPSAPFPQRPPEL